jgi:hypothetical protein
MERPATAAQAQRRSTWRRIGRWAGAFAALCFLLLALCVAANNISLRPVPREQLRSQLDRAIERGTVWVAAHADGMVNAPNSALFHMLADMDARAPNPRLRRVTDRFMSTRGDSLWRRMVDPLAATSIPELATLDQFQDYQRWLLFAMAPSQVALSDEDRRQMFAPDAHHWGSLTHQLFAVYIYRRAQGASPETDALISHLCERIAVEASWDFRVTDLYLQRVAFLLAAGRPDLVRRRWVERVLAWQQDDGGWASRWYGWGPGLAQFTWRRQESNAHTTVQGLWAVHLLRYRYPEWMR